MRKFSENESIPTRPDRAVINEFPYEPMEYTNKKYLEDDRKGAKVLTLAFAGVVIGLFLFLYFFI